MYIPNDWSWRSLTILQIFPAVIQIVFIWCMFHFPSFTRLNARWLIILRGPGISPLARLQGAVRGSIGHTRLLPWKWR